MTAKTILLCLLTLSYRNIHIANYSPIIDLFKLTKLTKCIIHVEDKCKKCNICFLKQEPSSSLKDTSKPFPYNNPYLSYLNNHNILFHLILQLEFQCISPHTLIHTYPHLEFVHFYLPNIIRHIHTISYLAPMAWSFISMDIK